MDFNKTVYTGRQGITEWHKDRFAADLKMIKMNSMTVDGDTVTVDGAVSSKRLAAWRLKALSGRVVTCSLKTARSNMASWLRA